MRRLLAILFLLIALPVFAAWKFNPFTGKQDYYEPAGAPADNAVTPLHLKAVGIPDNTMVPFWDSSGLFRWAPITGGGTPSGAVASETTFGVTPAAGVATAYSRGDHTHGTPANPVTAHESTYDHAKLHDNVTVLDSATIDFSLSGQQVTGSVVTTGLDCVVAGGNRGVMTGADKTKLDGIAAGATVGADWNVNVTNKPTLGTAAAKNIPASGDASATEVVFGTDTRLTNARTPSSHNNTYHSETYITASSAVAPNGAITPATKTKITYDAKGLVTAGADATGADVGLGAVDNTSDATKNAAVATLTNKMVALTEAPGTDNTATGTISSLTAGENLVPGDVVYFKSDGKVWKADANAAGAYPCMGMAIATIASGAAGNVLLWGIVRSDQWNWTVGGVIYLSTTAGGMTQTQPTATDDVIQILGIATHADRMFFRPDLTWITHT